MHLISHWDNAIDDIVWLSWPSEKILIVLRYIAKLRKAGIEYTHEFEE